MSAMWKRLDALAGRAVSAVFGEAILVKPTIKSEYRAGVPDPDRPEHETRGEFALEFDTEDLRGQRLRGEFAGVGRIVNAAAYVKVTDAEYAKLGYAVRNGDRVALTDRAGVPVYEVASVHPLDCGDHLLVLTKDIA